MTTIKKLSTAIATGAVLFSSIAPVAFATGTTLEISGNGSSSDNAVSTSNTNTSTVTQNNVANVTNDVHSTSSTGGNDANDNTGGNNLVRTGSAANSVDLSTSVNQNQADVNSCGCNSGDTTVTVSGNGSNSANDVTLDKTNTTALFQNNNAAISNTVDATSKTGDNDANRNTGGDNTVWSGPASTIVTVSNQANANVARTGGVVGAGNGATSLKIMGNGSRSDNSIDLSNDNSVTLVQGNNADITNDIDADARTGANDANDNTGGNTTVRTGSAQAGVGVDNMANFNAAELGCGCDMTLTGKVSGNGSSSYNDITADMSNDVAAFQDNLASLSNPVDADATTGWNDANRNTGPVLGVDPVTVWSGNAQDETRVSNAANMNSYGAGFTLPTGANVNLSFDLSSLLGFFNLM